jgi:N-hydroxyarylamine O-acetyltransferase
MSVRLDLPQYLARIGHQGPLAADIATLRALHQAHATTVPFENLDIQLGRPIHLDLESLQRKLVAARRGGYCFEQHTLFAAVLREVGFTVTTLAARVRYQTNAILPRTHSLLAVDVPEGRFIADVGFGGACPTGPLALVPDAEQELSVDTYRFTTEAAGAFVLQARLRGRWEDLYAFTLEEHFPADYEMANYYTSTHPESRFVTNVMAALPTVDGRRLAVRNHHFSVRKGDDMLEERDLSDDELLGVLRERFGLDLPAGSRFRALVHA